MTKKSTSSSKSTKGRLGIKELLLTLFLIIIVWAAQEFLGIDLLELDSSPTLEYDPAGQIQVFFTTPRYPDDDAYHYGGLDELLASAMDDAQTQIDVAAFELDLERVADAMIRAQERGVTVRFVTDEDYAEEESAERVDRAGIPTVLDERNAFMHNKFVVIDSRQVWMGSWNLTDNGTYRNNNNVLVIQSEMLAENYTAEFEEMFDGQFGPTSPENTPHPQLEIGEIKVETHFASEGHVPAHLLPILEDAQSSIYFMAFAYTDDDIAKVMVSKARAGLDVRGVMEARNAGGTGSEFEKLQRAGIDIAEDGNPYVMHHKVIIIDEAIVITGSYNFTASAADKNDENLLVIYSADIAAQYLEEFQRVYQQAKEQQ